MDNEFNTSLVIQSIGLTALQPLLAMGVYLPFTNSSLKPFNIMTILNDIIINRRGKILEFGSGISTILIARLAKLNDLPLTIYSVEHDNNWLSILKRIIRNESLEKYVKFIHAPLSSISIHRATYFWYETIKLDDQIENEKFDTLIVDGPPAWENGKEMSRYPALSYSMNHLLSECSIFLDDAKREGEAKIIKMWEEEYDVKFEILNDSLAFFSRGDMLNPRII